MLIKTADDKQKRLNLLAELQNSPLLDAYQKNWAGEERYRLQVGVQGERDAAHYIDTYFRDSPNYAVIHDLRLSVDGDIAQIDHLVISRYSHFFLLETKNFNGNLKINGMGEFSVSYDNGKTWGIPSPIEQSRRHEVILARLLDRLNISSGLLASKIKFWHVVLVGPKAIINRPDKAQFDTSNVIKADGFETWRKQHVEKLSGLEMLGMLANLRGSDKLREIAEKITRQHRPGDPLELPDFMRPKSPSPQTSQPSSPGRSQGNAGSVHKPSTDIPGNRLVCVKCGAHVTPAVARFCSDHAERFKGLLYCMSCQDEIPSQPPPPPARQPLPQESVPEKAASARKASTDAPEKRLICAKCGVKISISEGRFCWNNAKRFGGLQYCRTCQAEL